MSRWFRGTLSLILVFGLMLALVPRDSVSALAIPTPDKLAGTLIKLNKYSVELQPGEQFQLKAEVSIPDMDEKDVQWSSSESLIAQVDQNGLVTTFNKQGTVSIKASVGSLSVSCQIRVYPDKIDRVAWKDKPVNAVLGKTSAQYNVFEAKADNVKKDRILLSWKKQKKIKRYEVQRAKVGGGKYKTIAQQKNVKYTDKKVKNSTKYKYRICAVGTDGTRWYSGVIKVRALGKASLNEKPDTPSRVTAELYGSDVVGVKWEKADGADGYCVYRRDEDNGKYKLVRTIYGNKETEWMDQNRELYRIYEYKVSAFRNQKGKKIYSKKSYPVSARTYQGNYTKIVNAARVKIKLKGQDGAKKEINICSQISAKAVVEPEYTLYSDDERLVSDQIIWSSSDESILKVDKNGVITSGAKEGNCTIYARVHNGITKGVKIKVINFANPVKFSKYKGYYGNINRLMTTYRSEVRDIVTWYTLYGEKDRSGVIGLDSPQQELRLPGFKKISLVEQQIKKIVTEFPVMVSIRYDYGEISFVMSYGGSSCQIVTYSSKDRWNKSSDKVAPHWKFINYAPV